MHNYFWGSKEPCPCPEKECVIMKKSPKGLYEWLPAKCSEKHHSICRQYISGWYYIRKVNIF